MVVLTVVQRRVGEKPSDRGDARATRERRASDARYRARKTETAKRGGNRTATTRRADGEIRESRGGGNERLYIYFLSSRLLLFIRIANTQRRDAERDRHSRGRGAQGCFIHVRDYYRVTYSYITIFIFAIIRNGGRPTVMGHRSENDYTRCMR
jgi:hypothetical protein